MKSWAGHQLNERDHALINELMRLKDRRSQPKHYPYVATLVCAHSIEYATEICRGDVVWCGRCDNYQVISGVNAKKRKSQPHRQLGYLDRKEMETLTTKGNRWEPPKKVVAKKVAKANGNRGRASLIPEGVGLCRSGKHRWTEKGIISKEVRGRTQRMCKWCYADRLREGGGKK